MARRGRPADDAYDSDASFSPEDDGNLFDIHEDQDDAETDATDLGDLTDMDPDDEDVDVDDQIQLFGGNVHPPEHYRKAVEIFDKSAFDGEDYSPGSILLLDAVENNRSGL